MGQMGLNLISANSVIVITPLSISGVVTLWCGERICIIRKKPKRRISKMLVCPKCGSLFTTTGENTAGTWAKCLECKFTSNIKKFEVKIVPSKAEGQS